MFEWVANLFRGEKSSAEPTPAVLVKETTPKGPRPLTTLDVPMITARLETLGVFEALDPSHADRLKRMIQEQCRERVVGPWWIPLRQFLNEMIFRRRSPPVVVFSEKVTDSETLRDDIQRLAALLEGSRLLISGLRTGADAPLPEQIADGELIVHYRIGRGTPQTFSSRVEGGVLDVSGLVSQLNEILKQGSWTHRMLMLPPHEGDWAIVRCRAAVAERAVSTKWGVLSGSPPR